ncbi:MAG: hypothetical protein WCO98_04840 [bacterium]
MRTNLIAIIGLLLIFITTHAAELTPAFTSADLDIPNCAAFDGNIAKGVASVDTLEKIFGLRDGTATWEIGPLAGKDRHFRIAFNRPIVIGTIFTRFISRAGNTAKFQQDIGTTVSYLKPTAAYPGDISADDQWVVIAGGTLKTLPVGVITRALRFSDRYQTPQNFSSKMAKTLCFTERYYDAATMGYSRETGAAFTKQVWLGSWETPQAVAGFITKTICTTYLHVDYLKPDTKEVAMNAPDSRWKKLKDHTINTADFCVYRVDNPVETKAVRVYVDQNNAYVFQFVLALVNLGTTPNPPSLETMPPMPFQLKYDMPMDGFIALQLFDKKTSKPVRRLIAEVTRDKGIVSEPWDLKDDSGQYILPGDYTWKAITRPPLKLTYEGTVYNAGQPPWPAPVLGEGDWLGDHGAPNSACKVGDQIFIGCSVAEGGSSIIAVNHDGHKLWGEGALQLGFFGPDRIASDGRNAYFIRGNFIQQIDSQNNYSTRTISPVEVNNDLPMSPVTGAAGRGDKLYVAYNPPPVSWLQPPFTANEMDPKVSQPLVWLRKGKGHRGGREDKNYNESEYDELMKFYAAFLTETMPRNTPSQANMAIPCSTQAYFGDAAKGGSLVLAFHKQIPVGSIMVPDATIKVFALKQDAKMPKDASEKDINDPEAIGEDAEKANEKFNEDDWVELPVTGKPGHPGIALAPTGGLRTQALRFSATRLTFGLIMGHRLADLAPDAERVYGEGEETVTGGWSVKRDPKTPISKYTPARMALVWKDAVKLRGVSILSPTPLSTTTVDYWVGPANIDPKTVLDVDKYWKFAGQIQPITFAGYYSQSPTVCSVDFGAITDTRAVRVKVLEPEGYRRPPYESLPITTTHLAGFGNIVAYQSLGSDPELPITYDQRITEYKLPANDDKDGKITILRHLPIPEVGNIAFDPKGSLFAASEGQVISVPLDGGKSKTIFTRDKFDNIGDIAIDEDGIFYITDLGTKNIKVCDPKTGKITRTIGKPGGQKVGAWDPERFDKPLGIAIDSAGKLWVTDNSWQPKRVERINRDGKVEKWLLGPTQYGGGGWLDPNDRSLIYYNGMKFIFDWKERTWTLDSIIYRSGAKESSGGAPPARPVYLNKQRYLVGPDVGMGVATICEERDHIAVPMAATGPLESWGDVDIRPDLSEKFGKLMREAYSFLWWDKNADGTPQVDEVQLVEKRLGSAFVGEDLSFNYEGQRVRATIQPNGIPAYDLAKLEKAPFSRTGWVTADGRMFSMSTTNTFYAADGTTPLWTYPNPNNVHGGFYSSGFGGQRPPGVLTEEHVPIGHFTMGDEEYFVTNSDPGDWFCYTKDGLLAGCLLGGPIGYGLRSWSMPEWEAGKVDLTDMRPGQEHYHGCVVKSSDGKLYAVAGHHHVSLVRIDGLEQAKRLTGDCTVTSDNIQQQQQWEVLKATREKVRNEPKVTNMPYITATLGIDGMLDDWPDKLFVTLKDHWESSLIRTEHFIDAQAALAYDNDQLYVAVWAASKSPFKNSAKEPALLFKGGDAVDVTLGLDPKADQKRTTAGPGDVRLLISIVKGKPTVVLYRPVAPDAPEDKHWRFQSPVGETRMDLVKKLDNVEVATQLKTTLVSSGWILEAAIPWEEIGFPAPNIDDHIRGDIGILQGDQNGVSTVGRIYWSGKSQTVVCDIPSEARLLPSLWGEINCIEKPKEMKFGPDDVE